MSLSSNEYMFFSFYFSLWRCWGVGFYVFDLLPFSLLKFTLLCSACRIIYIVISEMERRGWPWKKKTTEKMEAIPSSDTASLASVGSLSDKVCSLWLKPKKCTKLVPHHSFCMSFQFFFLSYHLTCMRNSNLAYLYMLRGLTSN